MDGHTNTFCNLPPRTEKNVKVKYGSVNYGGSPSVWPRCAIDLLTVYISVLSLDYYKFVPLYIFTEERQLFTLF